MNIGNEELGLLIEALTDWIDSQEDDAAEYEKDDPELADKQVYISKGRFTLAKLILQLEKQLAK